jgi:broad specificity phosphatase PhoE
LLRHAETADPDRFHGAESDVGLGERGLVQAHAVGRWLAARSLDALYCSAMLRARQTAESIARACGLVPQIIPELHERRMGRLSGISREEGLGAYAEAKRRWMAGELDHTHEGGESYAAIRDRVVPVFERLAERSAGKRVIVVAHGVVIRVALTTLLDELAPGGFDRIAIDNVALNELDWDGIRWTAGALNRRVVPVNDSDDWVW